MFAKIISMLEKLFNSDAEVGIYLGDVRELTQGGPDGQWSDGNSPSNSFRFKK